ncbi:hypothetical protein PAXRUDRAFT_568567 [Paxillus rubicundulus Ve08.2h10]|uniref:Uncharacterized protein n=1 Tax=Paxillus rubicundulus Ve08.2h10 TaxID=930991 RepID=A0A0D0CEL6_9AGAM|nr:hypothetical protein PAXRUDRAFT_568567 [Paxillus rubicundulus Ve08.2h10]
MPHWGVRNYSSDPISAVQQTYRKPVSMRFYFGMAQGPAFFVSVSSTTNHNPELQRVVNHQRKGTLSPDPNVLPQKYRTAHRQT